MDSNPYIFIALPSYRGEFHPQMTNSLTALEQRTRREGVGVARKPVFGSIIPKNRNDLCDHFLQADEKWGIHFTHLLFIDGDMVFDDDAALRLLRLDRDIVSGLCVGRGEPYAPVVKKVSVDAVEGKTRNCLSCGHTIDAPLHRWETYPREPLREGRFISDADGTGCAFILIKRRVIETVKPPWFAMPPLDDAIMGEDLYFCAKAKEAGFDICVDSSLIIGHVSEHIATIDTYFNYKEEREQREKKNGK